MKQIFSFLFLLLPISVILSQNYTIEGAVALAGEGNFKEAIVALDSLINENPKVSDYYFAKSNCYLEIGEIDGAINTISSGIKEMPDSASFYDFRGVLFRELRMYDNAFKDFMNAVELTDNLKIKSHLYSNAGGIQFLTRAFEEAHQSLTTALEYDSTNIDALNNLAVISDEVGRTEETLIYLERVVKVDSNYLPAYVNLGFKHQLMGNHEKAIQYFNKCVELSPEEPLAFSNRAFSKLELGDVDGAYLDISKSILLLPSNSYAYKIRGLVFIKKGSKNSACEDFQTALRLGYKENFGEEVNELIKKHCIKMYKN